MFVDCKKGLKEICPCWEESEGCLEDDGNCVYGCDNCEHKECFDCPIAPIGE